MSVNYNRIRTGSRLRWNLEMGITYRRHIWEITFDNENGATIRPVSADGARLLTERRNVSMETITRFATLTN